MTSGAAFELAAPARIVFGAGAVGQIGGDRARAGRARPAGHRQRRAGAQRRSPAPLDAAGVRWTPFAVDGEPTVDDGARGRRRRRARPAAIS